MSEDIPAAQQDSPIAALFPSSGPPSPQPKGTSTGPASPSRGAADRHEDPVLALRSRQWGEYEKLCLELRLRHNSAIHQAFNPKEVLESAVESEEVKVHEVKTPSKKAVCQCGAVFAADAVFCLKCGRGRGKEIAGSADSKPCCRKCGNEFKEDSVFCRKCGTQRDNEDDKRDNEDHQQKARSVHEYSFDKLYLGDRQIPPLAAALSIDRHLVALFLQGCGMMDSGMIGLCEQLKRSQTLECLNVSSNRFSIGGAEACLRLVNGAQRLVLVRAKDTCLEVDFCDKRGLPAKYASVAKKVRETLIKKAQTIKDSDERP